MAWKFSSLIHLLHRDSQVKTLLSLWTWTSPLVKFSKCSIFHDPLRTFSIFVFVLSRNGHFHSNVVKLEVENDIVSTLSNVVHVNVEIHNVDSTLFEVVNSIVEIHNVFSTLVPRRDAVSTKIQRWNNVEMFAWLIRFSISGTTITALKELRSYCL